jgi:LuxR family quorum sensing-dependent transcriptional regulator
MDRLQRIDDFAREIAGAADVKELLPIVERQVKELGFERFNYRLPAGVSGARRGFFAGNYPVDWIERYLAANHEADDVILQSLARTILPFNWTDITNGRVTDAQRRVLNEASEFKLLSGAAVPIPGPGSARGQFVVGSSMAPAEFEKLFAVRRSELHLVAIYTHERAIGLVETDDQRLRVRLTARETEVLKWVARGKTAWEIGGILSLAEATVKEHVQNICRKFGVKTKIHATSLAIWHGYITI